MNHQSTLEAKTNKLNQIGLEEKNSKELAKKLNILLANYSIFYQNIRGYHWNLKGSRFFELHSKFEELYGNLYLKIDEIAERIATLGYIANHNFSDYRVESKIAEKTLVSDCKVATMDILNSFKTILTLQREILSLADEMGDEGTYNLISDAIIEQEKTVWMYSASIEE